MPRFFITATTLVDAPTKAEATELVRSRMNCDALPFNIDVGAEEIAPPEEERSQARLLFRRSDFLSDSRPKGVLA